MNKRLWLYIFPHVEDRRFVEVQLHNENHEVLAANVVLATQFTGDGIRTIVLRSPDEVYTKGQIL